MPQGETGWLQEAVRALGPCWRELVKLVKFTGPRQSVAKAGAGSKGRSRSRQ
jgi:hypothetical protein